MTVNTLFGYTVDDQDGKLVVTVHGSLAAESLKAIRDELIAGRGASLLSLLSQLGSIGKPKDGGSIPYDDPQQLADHLEAESLSQELEQTFAEFQQQMQDFHRSLDLVKASLERGPSKIKK